MTDRRLPDPDDCSWCDQPQRGHYSRWAMGVGFHKYTAPGNPTRLYRMRARRAARLAARQPQPPAPPQCQVTLTAVDNLTPALRTLAESLDFVLWDYDVKGGGS